MDKHEKINYVEFPSKDMQASKDFFATAFGWEFIDYGPDYRTILLQIENSEKEKFKCQPIQ